MSASARCRSPRRASSSAAAPARSPSSAATPGTPPQLGVDADERGGGRGSGDADVTGPVDAGASWTSPSCDEEQRPARVARRVARRRTTPTIPHIASASPTRARPAAPQARCTAPHQAVGDQLGLLEAGRLDHDPHDRLGAGRAHQDPAVGSPRSVSIDAASSQNSAADSERVAVARRRTFRRICGKRCMTPASRDRECPVPATTSRSMTPVSTPSPVVAWSRKMMWPDCSPPRTRSRRSIASMTWRSPTGVSTKPSPWVSRHLRSPRFDITVATTALLRSRSRSARSSAHTAMIWSPSTSPPRSSTAITRSASPSNASPTRAPESWTRSWSALGIGRPATGVDVACRPERR